MSSLNQQINVTLTLLLALTPCRSLHGQVPWTKPAAAQQDASPSASGVAPAPAVVAPQAPSATPVSQPLPPGAAPGSAPGHITFYAPVPGKKGKTEYVGPKTLVALAPTPLLDEEGRQRLDPEGKPMFNAPVRQQRDKRGNPLFDDNGKPVMQTPNDMGYDDKGKKIHIQVVKPPKTISVSIERGILTVDGMAGKAGLNYEIKDFKFIYLYAPWIGIAIVSHSPFPGAIEEKNAFDDKTLTVTAENHTLQLYSDKRLLGKNPESAFVALDRSFKLPAQSPVIGYGETMRAPYAWPGSRENAAAKGSAGPPPLPANLRPVTLLQPCPPGQMRTPGRTPLPGENLPTQPCVPIQKAIPGTGAPTVADTKPAAPAIPVPAPSAAAPPVPAAAAPAAPDTTSPSPATAPPPAPSAAPQNR